MKISSTTLLLGAAAIVAVAIAARSTSRGGDGDGDGDGDDPVVPPNPDVNLPVTNEEKWAYEVLGYSTQNIVETRIAYAGDLAAVAIAFKFTPGSTPLIRAREGASFAMGRASNLTSAERTALVLYLDRGDVIDDSLFNSALGKAQIAWKTTVFQGVNTVADLGELDDFDLA